VEAGALYRLIGERVAEVRQRPERRRSQLELGKAVGLSRTSIANLEKGRHRIQIHVLYEIALVLGVEPSDLLPPLSAFAPYHQNRHLPPSFRQELNPEELSAIARLLGGENVYRKDKKGG